MYEYRQYTYTHIQWTNSVFLKISLNIIIALNFFFVIKYLNTSVLYTYY